MLHKRIGNAARFLVLVALVVSAVCFYAIANRAESQSEPVPYEVLDDLQTRIKIGVGSEVDEKQLRATLRKAADDHQNDAARDLLLSDYLWVEAYLLDGQKQSSVPAGKLRRYVPPKQPRKHTDWFDWLPDLVGKKDKFYVKLEQAKNTLRQ